VDALESLCLLLAFLSPRFVSIDRLLDHVRVVDARVTIWLKTPLYYLQVDVEREGDRHSRPFDRYPTLVVGKAGSFNPVSLILLYPSCVGLESSRARGLKLLIEARASIVA